MRTQLKAKHFVEIVFLDSKDDVARFNLIDRSGRKIWKQGEDGKPDYVFTREDLDTSALSILDKKITDVFGET